MPKYKYTIRTSTAAIGLNCEKKEFNQMLRDAYEVVGEVWHKEMRASRFTHSGAAELGFRPRQGERGGASIKGGFKRSYTGRKLKMKGHTLPNVFSGESRMASKAATLRATSKGVYVALPGLRDWNRRKPKGWPAPLSAQFRIEGTGLGRISQAEQQKLARIHARYMDSRIKAFRKSQTRTVS
jgi:hypothetical protein